MPSTTVAVGLSDICVPACHSRFPEQLQSRDRKGAFHGPRRAAKGDEDAAQPVWGRPSGLPLGFRPARNFTSACNAGDLVASPHTNRVFDRATSRIIDSDTAGAITPSTS